MKSKYKVGKMYPISTVPKDGTYVILIGPSGYVTVPIRAEVGRWDAEYRPHNPFVTHSNDAFTDGGSEPTFWMPLPIEDGESKIVEPEPKITMYNF